MFRARRAPFRLLLALSATVLVLAGCAQASYDNPVPQAVPIQAVTETGAMASDLYLFVLAIATAIFLLVEGLIIFAVFRYRRRKGDDGLPAQTHGNLYFELAWTVVPFLIVMVLFVLSYQVQTKVDARSASPGVTVDVTGFQWQWTFDYKDQGLSFTGQGKDGPQMVLPIEHGGPRAAPRQRRDPFLLRARVLLQEGRPAGPHQRVRHHHHQRRHLQRPVRRVLRHRPCRHALHGARARPGGLHGLGRPGPGGGQEHAQPAAQRRAA